ANIGHSLVEAPDNTLRGKIESFALLGKFLDKLTSQLTPTKPIPGNDNLTATLLNLPRQEAEFKIQLDKVLQSTDLLTQFKSLLLPSGSTPDSSPVLSSYTKGLLKATPNPTGDDLFRINRSLLWDFYSYYYSVEFPAYSVQELVPRLNDL